MTTPSLTPDPGPGNGLCARESAPEPESIPQDTEARLNAPEARTAPQALPGVRSRLIAERDAAHAAARDSRRGDTGLVHSGIAAGLDIAIAAVDAATPAPPVGALRDAIAEAVHATSLCEVGDPIRCGGGCRDAADAVLAAPELAQRLAHLADYENRITWETNCGEHARLLDSCYAETVRADKAESDRARVSALHADTERRLRADLKAAIERAETAEQQLAAARALHTPCEERHPLDLSDPVVPHCDTCWRDYPCRTATALGDPKETS